LGRFFSLALLLFNRLLDSTGSRWRRCARPRVADVAEVFRRSKPGDRCHVMQKRQALDHAGDDVGRARCAIRVRATIPRGDLVDVDALDGLDRQRAEVLDCFIV